MGSFQMLDWMVVLAYFIVCMGIAWWVIRQKQQTSTDYFLAGRHIGWFIIGSSIFASNIGSEHVVGLAGTAAKTGFVMAHYEIHSWIVLLLGWVFVPFYMRSSVFTIPEFLEKRYNSTARWILSLISLVGYILTKVSVTVYAGAVVFQTLMGIEFWTGALIIIILTGIYTTLGGLKAVVYTDTLQSIVLVIGSVIITVMGLIKIGGWDNLVSILGHQHFNMFLPANDPNFPWVGMVLAPPIAGIWYWCTDQYIVQRTLSAKNETNARRGTIYAAFLKLLPIFIFFVPGLVALALSKSGKLELTSADQSFPALVKAILPTGLKGLVAGGLIAALMSSLSSVFNSASTLFTIDIYKKLKPTVSEKKLVSVGRIATAVVVISGILWIPLMKYISSELYTYLQSVQSYIAPPITAAFLLGIFWKRINAKGAVTGLIFGFVAGMIRLVIEIRKEALSGFLYQIADLNFLYFSLASFLCCIAVMIIVSHLTPKQDEQTIQGLTYATTVAADKKKSRASWNYKDVVLSLVVVAIIACILIYFSPLGIGG